MQIPEAVEGALSRLRDGGFRALLAGGCVRDWLLGVQPKDWDVATNARPEQVMAVLEGAQTVGAHFGVVLWRGVEVATFRGDGAYSDGRRPDSVRFVSGPEEDAARRDFTFNGMFFDPSTGEVIDSVGGMADLRAGLVRAIGHAQERFAEDHLRLLRAVRFAARLDFRLEEETARAIREGAGQIRRTSAERIRDELNRILTGPNPANGFRLLEETGLLEEVLPEVAAMRGVAQPADYHPEGDVWSHTLGLLEAMQSPSVSLAWGALLHDVAKPLTVVEEGGRVRFPGHAERGAQMAGAILHRLRLPDAVVGRVEMLVAQHLQFQNVRMMRTAKLARFLRQDGFDELLELHRLDRTASSGDLSAYVFCQEQLRALSPERLRPPRWVSGRELLTLGVPAGPAMGRILEALEDAQLEGRVETKEAALQLAAELAATERASEPSST